mgnify:CR=1 FL=1
MQNIIVEDSDGWENTIGQRDWVRTFCYSEDPSEDTKKANFVVWFVKESDAIEECHVNW